MRARVQACTGAAVALLCVAAPAQSLWLAPGAVERGAILDHVARDIGDLITVNVIENQRVQDDGKVEWTRESGLDSAIEVFDIKPNAFNTLPALKWSSERTLDGESKYTANGRFETTISAVVIDRKPNGLLLIEGYRTIQLDGEWKRMSVRGLVRPIDIDATNSVRSDRIANAQVLYDSDGQRSPSSDKTWFEEILDVLWPF